MWILVLLTSIRNSHWSDIAFLSMFSVGDRRWPQLQPYLPNQNRRLGPGHHSGVPHRLQNRRAFSSQGSGLRGSVWIRAHIHVHCRGPGHKGKHASWTSLCYSQNNGECVGMCLQASFSVWTERWVIFSLWHYDVAGIGRSLCFLVGV